MHTGLLSDYTHGVDPHDQVTPPWQGRKYWAVGTVSQTRLTSPVLPQGHVLNALCDEAKGSRAYPEYVPSPTRVYRVSLQAIRECIPQLAIVPFLLRTGNLRCTYYFVCSLPSRRFLLPVSGELALLRCRYYFCVFSSIETLFVARFW